MSVIGIYDVGATFRSPLHPVTGAPLALRQVQDERFDPLVVSPSNHERRGERPLVVTLNEVKGLGGRVERR
jgi:hypothetical protein